MLPISLISLTLSLVVSAYPTHPRSESCQTFNTNFPSSSVSQEQSYSNTPFVAIGPNADQSYKTTTDGLELYLQRPSGIIKTSEGVNNKVGEGATVNSTFKFLYGKVTFEVSAPVIPGVVTAVIFIADERDEIDVEILGGDQTHWQTNIFAPNGTSTDPMYGVFSSIEDLPNGSGIAETHKYTIDWNPERIVWSVDGQVSRTLRKDDTYRKGALHFPSHPARLQLGIWDASNPVGTAEWARGPIDWDSAPEKMKAVIKSVSVECP